MGESQANRFARSSLGQEVTLRCVDRYERSTELSAGFGYDPSDPYVVSVTFRSASGDVRWEFARELLLDGIHEPTGAGDVRIWTAVREGAPVLTMELTSPDGHLLAHGPFQPIYEFVARTLAVVPRGQESAHVDLDAELLRILA